MTVDTTQGPARGRTVCDGLPYRLARDGGGQRRHRHPHRPQPLRGDPPRRLRTPPVGRRRRREKRDDPCPSRGHLGRRPGALLLPRRRSSWWLPDGRLDSIARDRARDRRRPSLRGPRRLVHDRDVCRPRRALAGPAGRRLGAEAADACARRQPGVNGYTSRTSSTSSCHSSPALEPEFVTLLIGVNDVVQGVPATAFQRNVDAILDDLGRSERTDRRRDDAGLHGHPGRRRLGDPPQQAAGISGTTTILARLAEPAASPSSTSTTSPSARRPTARSSPATASTRAVRSTPAGWTASLPAVEALLGR